MPRTWPGKLAAVPRPPVTAPPAEAEIRAARLVLARARLAALEELAELTEKLTELRSEGTP